MLASAASVEIDYVRLHTTVRQAFAVADGDGTAMAGK